MDIWQIILISYLVLGLGIAIAIFRFRRTLSPDRAELLPSIVASFFSGVVWGIALPVVVMRLFLLRKKTG